MITRVCCRLIMLFLLLAPALAIRVTPACAAAADEATTVILVRHAEKDTLVLGSDPPLSARGFVRAQELRRVLADAAVSAIYVTPWQRNRQTAQPLATALGETLIVIDAIDSTIAHARADHRGKTVLVVGHSNTVPQIITGLTGRPFPAAAGVPYDAMWVVTLRDGAPATLLTLRWGAETVTPVETRAAPARR
jgi:2,3-bisphosphoglycerate-dependent phosphoglycerate mutase